MDRRIVTIIAIVVLLGVGAVLFYLFTQPTGPGERSPFGNLPIIGGRTPLETTPPPPAPSGTKPGDVEARLRQIIEKDILAPTLSKDQRSLLYVDRATGHVMASDLEGNNETTVVNLTILEAFDGAWSPTKTKVALAYHETGVVKRFIEETATGTPSRFLPSDVQSLAWSPDGKSMAYLIPQGANTGLVVADQNARNARTVYSTPIPDFTVTWAAPNTLLLVSKPSGLAPSLALRFDLASRRATPILQGTRGVILFPLPDGGGFVFSQSDESGSAGPLSAYSFKDGAITPLGLTTLAEKCTARTDSKKLYCGVPRGIIQSPSPDEWYRGAVAFTDTIVAVDAATGQASAVLEDMPPIDVVSPFLTADERFLFFQDKQTGTLWRLAL